MLPVPNPNALRDSKSQTGNRPARPSTPIDFVEYFDSLAPTRDRWIKKNWYYHDQLARTLSFFIPVDSSVLAVGSGTGVLLNSLQPKRGLGIDISPAMVHAARLKYPHLEFRVDD